MDASVSVAEAYSDNIFDTENNRIGDLIRIIQPSLRLSIEGARAQGSIGADLEIGRFASHTSENYEDLTLRAAGDVRVLPAVKLFGGGDYAWEHEDRSSPDDVNGFEPTKYQEGSAYLGALGQFGRWSIRIGGNLRQLDFDDVTSSTGTINNDDRDRLETETGARVGYKLDSTTEVFGQGIYDNRAYRSNADDALVQRDSDGFQAAVGVKGRRGAVSGEIKLGVLHQAYDDTRFDAVTTLDMDADLRWTVRSNMIVSGNLSRSINETTLAGASSYTDTTAGIALNHRVTADVSANAYFSLSENAYNGLDRTDYLAFAGFGLQYFVLPHIYVGAEYNYAQRLSDASGVQYDRHGVLIRIGAQLDRAYPEGASTTARVTGRGFYVGAYAADGGLETRVDGPRGGSGGMGAGNLTAGFGDHGLAGGVIGGYRVELEDFVVGAELDLQIAAPEWDHMANRTFGVGKDNQVGLSLLAGHKVRGDALLYARGGVVSTAFDSTYRRGGNRTALDDRHLGLSLGLGTEFPIAGGFSARMEYLVTAYDDYDIGAPFGADDDNFANVENQARFGLIYRFGADPEEEAPAPFDFNGLYVGAQGDHGMLATENSGPRLEGNGPDFILDATRAGQGFTGGVFVGYGHRFGSLFAAVEAEAELSNLDWNIERDPNGRVYSAEKDWTVGVSARGGYILNDTVLLYGRVGVVGSGFRTDYSIGSNQISQDNVLAGVRFGGGVEVAIADATTVRMDYTRTEYASYSLNYNSGVDSFDHRENLFRVGIAQRF